jgi:hypothetical protein
MLASKLIYYDEKNIAQCPPNENYKIKILI